MRKKFMCFFIAVLLLPMLASSARAAELTGTIRVTLGMQEGEVALYLVGTKAEGGYLLREKYGGGFIKADDAHSAALAQWLAEAADGEGRYCKLDDNGSAEFSQVPEGLYLLIQTRSQRGYYTVAPFMISLPSEGHWNIQANPKSQQSPPTGQDITPFLGIVGMVLSGGAMVGIFAKKKRT